MTIQSIYEILINSNLPKPILESQTLTLCLQKLKQSLYTPTFKPSSIDRLLFSAFNEKGRKEVTEKIIPISHILQLETQQFAMLLSNLEIVERIFIFLGAFGKD